MSLPIIVTDTLVMPGSPFIGESVEVRAELTISGVGLGFIPNRKK
jgi:hypothetical protein